MSPLEPPSSVVLRDPENLLPKRIWGALIFMPLGAIFLAIFIGFGPALLVAVVIIAALALLNREAMQALLRWHPPQLEVAPIPYAIGATPTVTYRRRPKRPTDVSDCAIECRLYCTERVVYSRGTDTQTDTQTVHEYKTTGTGEGTADGLVATVELYFSPHAGGPSLELPNNQVRWFIDVGLSGARLPHDSHTFAIEVAPKLDPSLWGRLQDS